MLKFVGLGAAALLLTSCLPAHTRAVANSTASAARGATPTPRFSPIPTVESPIPLPTTATSARVQCSAVQQAPLFVSSAPSSRNLALVWLRGNDSLLVRDITDINHPFTASTLGGLASIGGPNAAFAPAFVNAFDISYYNDSSLVRKPFDGSPQTVTHLCNGTNGFAWSPDGKTAAYVTDTPDYSGGELHLVSGGQDRVVSALPVFTPAGCEASCEHVDFRLVFSPDGAYLSMANSWPGPSFRVWRASGELLNSSDSGLHTWSVWSGSTLYFRTDQGVATWHAGQTALLLPGVAWVSAHASPGGGQIVYFVRDASHVAHLDLLDTSTGKVRELASSRSWPAFLTPRYVWYIGERACASGDQYPCPFEGTIATGKTYIYDLQTGTESESIITRVWDVWPHPA